MVRGLARGLLWGGLAVAVLAATQAWWTAGERTAAGSQTTPGAAVALMLAAAAGAFLGGWLAPLLRRVVLVLVAILAAAAVAVALTAAVPVLPGSTLGDPVVLAATPWRWVYLAAAALAAGGAVRSIFVRPQEPRSTSAAGGPLDAWKALDAGTDPTVGSPERAKGGDGHPKPPE